MVIIKWNPFSGLGEGSFKMTKGEVLEMIYDVLRNPLKPALASFLKINDITMYDDDGLESSEVCITTDDGKTTQVWVIKAADIVETDSIYNID